MAHSSDRDCLLSDFCSSGRDFAPRFLQTAPHGALSPLRFASTSPPSGCAGDLHPLAVEHARHTMLSPLRGFRMRQTELSLICTVGLRREELGVVNLEIALRLEPP